MKKLDSSKFTPNFDFIVDIGQVLEKYPTASYVGQFPLKLKSHTDDTSFTDWYADVFYEPNPRKDLGHGHYFAFYVREGSLFVTGAEHVEDLVLSVFTDLKGDYIYSRYQHDFRSFTAAVVGDPADYQQMSIDGGWWMKISDMPGKYGMIGRTLWDKGAFQAGKSVIVRDGNFYEIEEGDIL